MFTYTFKLHAAAAAASAPAAPAAAPAAAAQSTQATGAAFNNAVQTQQGAQGNTAAQQASDTFKSTLSDAGMSKADIDKAANADGNSLMNGKEFNAAMKQMAEDQKKAEDAKKAAEAPKCGSGGAGSAGGACGAGGAGQDDAAAKAKKLAQLLGISEEDAKKMLSDPSMKDKVDAALKGDKTAVSELKSKVQGSSEKGSNDNNPSGNKEVDQFLQMMGGKKY